MYAMPLYYTIDGIEIRPAPVWDLENTYSRPKIKAYNKFVHILIQVKRIGETVHEILRHGKLEVPERGVALVLHAGQRSIRGLRV